MAHTLLIALALLPLAQDTSKPKVRDLAPFLESFRAEAELPALAAAVIQGADLVALGAVGRRRIDRKNEVQPTDLWHLGSCTKSMTATWVAVLVERAELAWDMALGDAFPDLVEDDAMLPAWREVPLEWLLSNRSGARTICSCQLQVSTGGSISSERSADPQGSMVQALRRRVITVLDSRGG